MTIRQWLMKLFGITIPVKKPVVTPAPKPTPTPTPVPDTPATDTTGREMAVPLVRALGKTDSEVDAILRKRWEAGNEDACGGLPGDVRPLFIRPCGKTFGWKYPVICQDIRIVIDGGMMTIWDGKCEGLDATICGASDHEMPANGKPETLDDWVPIRSGVKGPRKHFAYFKCWKPVVAP